MKKMFYFMFCMMTVLAFTSCSDDDDEEGYKLYPIIVQLQYPAESAEGPEDGVEVVLKNSVNNTEYKQVTDDAGVAKFEVPEGLYEASASEQRAEGGKLFLFNGLNTNVVVSQTSTTATLSMKVSMGGSVVIKELYFGGCQKNDGSGRFAMDQYVILYNNSSETLDLDDFAFATVNPYNATTSNKDYKDGVLSYAAKKVIPAGPGVWYFQDDVKLAAGQQVVISITGAVNHTVTYSNSVDLSKADYCFYDLEFFDNGKYYPAPSENIPATHYLKAYKYGLGNAWPMSQMSPTFFVFDPEDVDLKAFVDDKSTTDYYDGKETMARKLVPEAWIVDGIEVFESGKQALKRLTEGVDAGYIELKNGQGYTVYRNVDKAATEAIKENAGKLVTGYADDPSGIDAEASLKNGARIIYMDTNNSTNDFHVRKVASLKK